jgi:hypothetical protein
MRLGLRLFFRWRYVSSPYIALVPYNAVPRPLLSLYPLYEGVRTCCVTAELPG